MATKYRYGISFLSKQRYGEAKPQEVLIDKKTGQVSYKNDDGSIDSYDYQTRVGLALNNMEHICDKFLLKGTIHEVVLSKDLPSVVDSSKNAIEGDFIPLETNHRYLLHLDVDVLNKSNIFSKKISSNDNVRVRVDISRTPKNTNISASDVTGSTVLDLELDYINETIIDIKKYFNDTDNYNYSIGAIYLTAISSSTGSRRSTINVSTNKILLHNILIMSI